MNDDPRVWWRVGGVTVLISVHCLTRKDGTKLVINVNWTPQYARNN